jgi:predicted ArsR family transcriptional regulator
MVSWHEGAAELFGVVDSDERRHWETVRDHGPVDVAQVAGLLAIEQAIALNQLERLVRRRLLMERDRQYAVPMAVPMVAPDGVRGAA